LTAFALTLLLERPVSKAGQILGMSNPKRWRIVFAHVETAWRN
jgi:hypothetical protein